MLLYDRRNIISDYLRSNNIYGHLPKGRLLSGEMSVPYKDGEICFPFVIGKKYLRDETYDWKKEYPVYVIGIIRASGLTRLLAVGPEGDIGCFSREDMLPPEVMLQ